MRLSNILNTIAPTHAAAARKLGVPRLTVLRWMRPSGRPQHRARQADHRSAGEGATRDRRGLASSLRGALGSAEGDPMTADTTQTASDDDTPAACTICGEAVDTADRWTCCAPVSGRWALDLSRVRRAAGQPVVTQ
jgi:hypothetical protein